MLHQQSRNGASTVTLLWCDKCASMPVWVLPVMPSMQVYQGSLRLQAAGLMAEQLKARRTPEQAFCAAIRRLAEDPPQASALEAGHKEGFSNGLLLFEPLYSLLAGNPDNLSIDRFANHLMQLTSNKVRVSLGSYWRNQSRFDDALLVQHPSKKPMSLAKLMEILRQSCTSIWLAQTAGTQNWTLLVPQYCGLGLWSLCSMLTFTLVQHADHSLGQALWPHFSSQSHL